MLPVAPAYINGYLTDFAAGPVIATLGLCFMRVVVIRNNYYVLSPKQVAFVIIYLSLLFEGLLPLLSNKYTADWADIVLYASGGIFFYKVINKPLT